MHNPTSKYLVILNLAVISMIASVYLAIVYSGQLSMESSTMLLISILIGVPAFFSMGIFVGKRMANSKQKSEESSEIKKRNQRLREEIRVRKAREKELIEARHEALRGIQAKDQFLSNMSHEIRTPMNGIIGLINILSDSKLTKEQRKYVSAIDFSAKSLLVLINEILDLSKINSEKLTLEKIDFNLRESIRSVENTFQVTAAEKGIFLRTLLDPKLPEMACGDPVRLNQVLLNLMGNAIKFTNEGGVDLIVNLSEENEDGPRLHIEVNDTGIGIPTDKLGDIFEKFTQATTETSRKFGGTGLGLAISKELVGLMGGAIKVESKEGKGSSFSFQVQLAPALNPNTKKISSTPEPKKELLAEEISVLVAEDNEVNQLVVTTTLKRQGFKVKVVPNGQEVIESIFSEPFDVILMDVHMPLMDGLDATRFIRNATEPPLSEIKIIGMTASVMKDEIDRCFEVGMDDYVPKPFSPVELFDKILKHHLGRTHSV